MIGLGEAAVGGLDLLEAGIVLKLEKIERTQFVAASAAVAGTAPAIMVGALEGAGIALLVGLASGGILGRQALKIIPVAIIFGGVRLAEIPAVAAVGRFGRRPV